MGIRENISADLKQAMKDKDTATRDTLRLISAAIKQIEVDDQKELDEDGLQAVLMKQAKQRRESISEYEKAGRNDLADPEKVELAVIEKYKTNYSQWVPIMFVRMLKLPEPARMKYDVSSMMLALHAAAPCPICLLYTSDAADE